MQFGYRLKSVLILLPVLLVIASAMLDRSGFASAPEQGGQPIDRRVRSEVANFKGKVSLFAKNLNNGTSYELDADDRVRTASTIKIAVMIEAYAQVAEGRAKWTDKLVLTDAKKVTGSGVLQEMSDGLIVTLRDAVNLMMVVSDNTATNLVLDHLTTDAVNERMERLGLKQTRILRKVGGGGTTKAGEDPSLKPYGLGISTPREMVALMEKLYRGESVSASASRDMLALMKREQNRPGIGRDIQGIDMATKYGALDHLRSGVGIIFSRHAPIALAITCDDMPEVNWTDDNPAYLLMSRLSEILVEELAKEKG